MIHNTINRIIQMEKFFDELQNAANENSTAIFRDDSLKGSLRSLTEYYESGQWLRDYELDEKGLIPKDLKRGVLSQDALFDFLEKIKRMER